MPKNKARHDYYRGELCFKNRLVFHLCRLLENLHLLRQNLHGFFLNYGPAFSQNSLMCR